MICLINICHLYFTLNINYYLSQNQYNQCTHAEKKANYRKVFLVNTVPLQSQLFNQFVILLSFVYLNVHIALHTGEHITYLLLYLAFFMRHILAIIAQKKLQFYIITFNCYIVFYYVVHLYLFEQSPVDGPSMASPHCLFCFMCLIEIIAVKPLFAVFI